ncbi:methyl-accepting chemotaxis protein [Thermodesulfobacteriota bacterium]
MANFVTKSIFGRLLLFFLLVALVPLAIVGYLSFKSAGAALEERVLAELTAAGDGGARIVLEYLEETSGDMKMFAHDEHVEGALERLSTGGHGDAGHKKGEMRSHEASPSAGQEGKKKIFSSLDNFFSVYLDIQGAESGYEDFLLISNRGYVMYSYKKGSDLDANVKTGDLKGTALAKMWSDIMNTGKAHMADFAIYAPIDTPAAFSGVPVRNEKKELIGVLAVRMSATRINNIVKEIATIGKTGDAFIVGVDFLLRSNSRQYGSGILEKKIKTKATEEALSDRSGAGEIIGPAGVPVLSAWLDVMIREQNTFEATWEWALIVAVDSSEALAPVRALAYRIIMIAIAIALAVALVALILARTMAKPVADLAGYVGQVRSGDLTVEIPQQSRQDEIGSLTTAFREMLLSMKQQTSQMLEGVNVLSSAAAEISSTATQLAASTSRTSSAVTETTTTVEQVRQSAKVASEKARNVAEASRQAVQISESGRMATEETVQRIVLIKDQMNSIGGTVEKLSEQSQAVEDIVSTVQDLADQSNLLAVNASIEAARAGDQGKGFAVVANEIKSLADQSKEATEEIRSILGDTRNWINAVVMAAEQGNKAVEVGVEKSVLAGESIQSLAGSVTESAQAASVIQASSEQQFVGVGQVSSAMGNIEQAMDQNLQGTSQLQDAARRLDQLGGSLKSLVEHYKV